MTSSQDKPKLHKTSFLISDMLASPPTSEPAPLKALDLRKSLPCPPLSLPYLSPVSSLLARTPLSPLYPPLSPLLIPSLNPLSLMRPPRALCTLAVLCWLVFRLGKSVASLWTMSGILASVPDCLNCRRIRQMASCSETPVGAWE